MQVPARILVADAEPLIRCGLRSIIAAQPDMTLAAEATDGEEALRIAQSDDLDVAIVDVGLPGRSGWHVATKLVEVRPDLKVLMLSAHDGEMPRAAAERVGACGYFRKDAGEREIVACLRAAVDGESCVTLGSAPVDPLSVREREVLVLIAQGFSSDEIADELVISRRTVDHHRSHILAKLGMRDAVELTLYAIRTGLVQNP